MKKIERPHWTKFLDKDHERIWNDWFTDNIEPINKMIDEARPIKLTEHMGMWMFNHDTQTHEAYLIDIKPIGKDTAEDI